MKKYKFVALGVFALIMAEDDEAVMNKCFTNLNTVRVAQQAAGEYVSFDKPMLICSAGIWRHDSDEVVALMEVWTDAVKFLPPEGVVQ